MPFCPRDITAASQSPQHRWGTALNRGAAVMLNRALGHAGPFAAKQDHGGSRCWEQAAAGAQRGHVMDRTGDAQQGTDGHGLAAGLCTGTPAVPGVMGNTGRICTQTSPLSCPSAFCCLPPGCFPDRRADSSQPSQCSALQRSRDGGGSAGAHTEPGMHGMCCNGGGVPGAHRFSCTMEAPFPDPHAALLNPPRVLPSSYPSWHPQIILGGEGIQSSCTHTVVPTLQKALVGWLTAVPEHIQGWGNTIPELCAAPAAAGNILHGASMSHGWAGALRVDTVCRKMPTFHLKHGLAKPEPQPSRATAAPGLS